MLLRYFIVFSVFPSLILALVCVKFDLIKGKKIRYKACCNGYKLISNTASKPNCVPICLENCGNGLCSSPYTCSCNEGYDNIEHLPSNRCVPACKRGCNNGECVAPETCHCNEGYKLDESTGRCLIGFIKSWMTELAVGLVVVIVLTIGVGIFISMHKYRKYEVAKRDREINTIVNKNTTTTTIITYV